jgi:hypothetical protein
LRRELHGHDAERDDHAPGHGVVDDFVVHGVVEQEQVHVHEKTNEEQHASVCVLADDGIYGTREREGHCAFELVGDLGARERHASVHGGFIYAFGCFIVIIKKMGLKIVYFGACAIFICNSTSLANALMGLILGDLFLDILCFSSMNLPKFSIVIF